jgi:hypothetical protein
LLLRSGIAGGLRWQVKVRREPVMSALLDPNRSDRSLLQTQGILFLPRKLHLAHLRLGPDWRTTIRSKLVLQIAVKAGPKPLVDRPIRGSSSPLFSMV